MVRDARRCTVLGVFTHSDQSWTLFIQLTHSELSPDCHLSNAVLELRMVDQTQTRDKE